ncbi:MAG TPA: hypothetical protein VF137_09615 [Candidatus Dormibacteraeota bacterium]
MLLGLAGVAIAAAFGLFGGVAGQFSGAPSTAEVAVGGLGILIAIVMAPVTAYAVWRAAMAAVLGEPASARSVLRDVTHVYWRLWLLLLGYGALLVLAAIPVLTCIGIALTAWLLVKWSVVVPAWFGERRRLGDALSRSWSLTRLNWWRLFGILLLFYVLYEAVSAALGSFSLAAAFVPRAWIIPATVANVAVELALSTVLTPLFPLVLTLLYFDLRVRHEHLDLEVMARELSGGGPGLAPPPPGPVPT